jgi:hypothetical protein
MFVALPSLPRICAVFRRIPACPGLARRLQPLLVNAGPKVIVPARRAAWLAGSMEVIMKPRTLIVAAGLAVAAAMPAYAQSARVTVGAIVSAVPQYPQPAPSPQQPSRSLGRPGPGGYGGYLWRGPREVALNHGFGDGYEQGFEAAHHRDRYDPRREGWYRSAERGYDRDYHLSRNEYRDIYRRGFLQGYESGYRDGQREWRGAYGRHDGYNRQPQGGWPRTW